jgi:argininosuccinate synthase
MPKRIALAYSGGLDTSCIIPWLLEHYDGDCEVIAVVGDVGQDDDDLAGVERKARQSGAVDCHIVDLKREFIEDFAYPALMAGAIYEGRYMLGTAIARPILARAQVDVALQTGCDALAHGCTGKGNDQVRFESAYAALAPELEVIAPWRLWSLRGREDLLNYLKKHNVPTTASATKIYSRDANLWHISHEGGELEDPWNAPPEDIWLRTVAPDKAPAEAEDVMIGFEHGRPRTVDGQPLEPEELVRVLNARAGRHGIGRVDLIENRLVGMKSRGCYETPGGAVLHEALHGLMQLTLDHKTMQLREWLGLRLADVIYNGEWFTAQREILWSAIDKMCERVAGDVVVRMHRGVATTIKRRSEHSLFSQDFATFSADEVYNQKDAAGFIRLYSLPARIAALRQRQDSPQAGSR